MAATRAPVVWGVWKRRSAGEELLLKTVCCRLEEAGREWETGRREGIGGGKRAGFEGRRGRSWEEEERDSVRNTNVLYSKVLYNYVHMYILRYCIITVTKPL